MSDYPLLELTCEPHDVISTIPVEPIKPFDLDPDDVELLELDVIHDGHYIPSEFLVDHDGNPITFDFLDEDYVRERDWGASLITERVAARLGVREYTKIHIARVLMDFGRFPGITPKHADHLHRYAINYPFSDMLSFSQKKRVLETCYDRCSEVMEGLLEGKRVKFAIHTYDQYNESGTERPAMSVMTRSLAYQNDSELPAGLFDPLYPDILAEFTADRVLRDRLSLTLEKARIPVAHNYPYCLPEGSLEVRYQVWCYFQHLRDVFEGVYPQTRMDEAFQAIWSMLLDTNLRSSESDALRSFIHMYRRAPTGSEALFDASAVAYGRICDFCREAGSDFVQRYRFSPMRGSSIGLEVRKDLICELDEEGRPASVRWDRVNFIGDTLAHAIATYLREDRHRAPVDLELERHEAWFFQN